MAAIPIFDINHQSVVHIFDVDDLAGIAGHYATEGYAVIRVVDVQFCEDAIEEKKKKVIGSQDWVLKTEFPNTEPPYSKKQRKLLEQGWPLHKQFGAPCDDAGFHLDSSWKLREDVAINRVAEMLMGMTDGIMVDINRPKMVLPGYGQEEFAHMDFNWWHSVQQKGIAGLVAYTDLQFLCVPGTHTEEFGTMFKEQYPKSKKTVYVLDEENDPMSLVQFMETINVPAGCWVIWDSKLVHATKKTSIKSPVVYGAYLGFMVKSEEREQAYADACEKEEFPRITESEDRIRSYENGVAPYLWPSLGPIRYLPKQYYFCNHLTETAIARLPKDSTRITTRVQKNGKTVPHLLPVVNKNYFKPKLTPLGEKRLRGT